MTPKIFYRYEMIYHNNFSGNHVKLELIEFDLIKETKEGYWIDVYGSKKWIRKNIIKKSFAYATKKDAIINYVRRTEIRIGYIRKSLFNTEDSLKLAYDEHKKVTGKSIKRKFNIF